MEAPRFCNWRIGTQAISIGLGIMASDSRDRKCWKSDCVGGAQARPRDDRAPRCNLTYLNIN